MSESEKFISRVYRSRTTNKEYTQYPDKLEKLRELFQRMGSKHDRELSKITITNYVNKLNKLSTIVLGHGYNGTHNWLTDADNVIKKLQDTQLSGKKDFLSPVVKLLKHIDASQEIIGKYQKAMSEFKDDEYTLRRKNKASQEHVNNALPLGEVLKRIDAYEVKDDTSLIYKLICSMYFQNTFVPRNDLPTMKFVSSSKKLKDMNPEFNYITLDKLNEPKEIIMKNYKSRNTYGVQRFPITKETGDLIRAYIKSYGKRAGDFVFVMRDGQPFKKPNFIDLIKTATNTVLGKPMTADLMRQIIITSYYNEHAHSIEEDNKFHMRFLHSSTIGKEYLKTNFPKEVKDDSEDT